MISTSEPAGMSWDKIVEVATSPAAKALVGVLLGLLGWDATIAKARKKAAEVALKLEQRVVDAAVNAAHDVVDLVQRGEVAVDAAIAKWDARWSGALAPFGIDVGDLGDDLKMRAVGAARKVLKELHIHAPQSSYLEKKTLAELAANFERAYIEGAQRVLESEAALIRASNETKRRKAAAAAAKGS